MKASRSILLFVVCISLLCITACSLVYPKAKPYEGGLSLTKITTAPWSQRRGHQVVMLHDSIILIGGYSPYGAGRDSYMEDVWISSDKGKEWELLTDTAPWDGRWGHSAVVLDSTIYISGGFYQNEDNSEQRGYARDIWKSTNGKDWELVTSEAPWVGRMGHAMFADASGNLYVLGGVRNSRDYLGDLWKSSDKGVTWTLVSASGTLPFGSRGFPLFAQHENFLFLFGGNTDRPYNPEPGATGTLSTLFRWDMDTNTWSSFPSPARAYRWKGSMEIMNKSLWLLQGQAFESNEFYTKTSTAVYRIPLEELVGTDPSPTWLLDSETAPIDPRYSYDTLSLGDSILLFGGQSGKGLQHDVWRLR